VTYESIMGSIAVTVGTMREAGFEPSTVILGEAEEICILGNTRDFLPSCTVDGGMILGLAAIVDRKSRSRLEVACKVRV